LTAFNLQAQTYINKEWETTNGNPLGLQLTSSVTNSSNQLISVGNTSVAGQGANILITKFERDGSIIWQSEFNTSGTNNDYGVALTEDNVGNIIVVGTTDNNSTINFDVVVLKYNTSGNLLWSAVYNSSFNLNDIATSVKVDTSGNVYVGATSIGATTNFDFLVLKYNSSGALQWNNRYDFASLIEIPIGVNIDINGDVFITGASASSSISWDFTIAKFSPNGTFINDVRSSLQGVGFDQPLAYKKDAAGNIYITGRSSAIMTFAPSNSTQTIFCNGAKYLILMAKKMLPMLLMLMPQEMFILAAT